MSVCRCAVLRPSKKYLRAAAFDATTRKTTRSVREQNEINRIRRQYEFSNARRSQQKFFRQQFEKIPISMRLCGCVCIAVLVRSGTLTMTSIVDNNVESSTLSNCCYIISLGKTRFLCECNARSYYIVGTQSSTQPSKCFHLILNDCAMQAADRVEYWLHHYTFFIPRNKMNGEAEANTSDIIA